MIDFHSHILPNIDDGSTSMEKTINLIKEAKEVGFTKIISTSHYIEEYYEVNEQERTKLLNDIKNEVHDIELYLGSEIYVTGQMVELIEEQKASTINKSRYVLFELPMNSKTMDAKEVVYRLMEKGYVPTIAHPERYSYVQENPNILIPLIEQGTLFQSNYGSIIGMYGKKAQKTMKKLLKQGLIHFLGSDVHRPNQIYSEIPKCIKKIRKIISEEELEELTTLNAQKVLNNEEI